METDTYEETPIIDDYTYLLSNPILVNDKNLWTEIVIHINTEDKLKILFEILPFTFNNTLNDAHVAKIKENIMSINFIKNDFTYIKHNHVSTLRLLDGHHRMRAIKELHDEGILTPQILNNIFPLYITIYSLKCQCKFKDALPTTDDIDNITTCNLVLDMFNLFNNVKPFHIIVMETDTEIAKDIARKIKHHYRNQDLITTLCNPRKPKINYEILISYMYNFVISPKVKNLLKYNILKKDDIVNNFIKLNNNLKNKDAKYMYERRAGTIQEKIFNICEEHNFKIYIWLIAKPKMEIIYELLSKLPSH